MNRIVKPELLDALAPDDPRALRSRADLWRINRLMRHGPILHTELASAAQSPPRLIGDIGAGDGSLMLKLAAKMNERWPGVRVALVDRQRVATALTLERFHRFGWQAETVVADVFEWLACDGAAADAVVANLFLHHFEDSALRELFRLLARRTNLLIACEPRRNWPSLAITPFLGLLGCNVVTRHDARVSVKAGFVGRELSTLWPERDGWQLRERRAGVFTHLFVAQRTR